MSTADCSSSSSHDDQLALHKAAFNDDLAQIKVLLQQGANAAVKDRYGNTALHIAVMLGHHDVVKALLPKSNPNSRNADGWTALDEAISRGHRAILKDVFKRHWLATQETIRNKKADMNNVLNSIGDFYMEIKWQFQSWIPLVSRILPADVCKIVKKGGCIRMDTTLLDFQNMKWERGDLTILYRADSDPDDRFILMDNIKKTYQKLHPSRLINDGPSTVNELLTMDIAHIHLSTKNVAFNRMQLGWLFPSNRTEKIAKFNADFYEITGLQIVTKKRREHLTDEEVSRNKRFFTGEDIQESDFEAAKHKDLAPIPPCELLWEEYISPDNESAPLLGRKQVVKATRKAVKATIAMSEEFPFTTEDFLNVLLVLAPFKHFDKLREFIEMKLPPGFPVRLEFPLFPALTAQVTFPEFEYRENISSRLFIIPDSYEETKSGTPKRTARDPNGD